MGISDEDIMDYFGENKMGRLDGYGVSHNDCSMSKQRSTGQEMSVTPINRAVYIYIICRISSQNKSSELAARKYKKKSERIDKLMKETKPSVECKLLRSLILKSLLSWKGVAQLGVKGEQKREHN